MSILFRWAAWQPRPELMFMLSHSVASFRRIFGDAARYVVFSDDPAAVEALRMCDFEVLSSDTTSGRFNDPRATWRKWAPAPRTDPSATEIYVDSDVFLLAPPEAMISFCSGQSGMRFLASMEEFHEDWPYGNFARLLPQGFRPINAGIVGQYAGSSLAPALEAAYDWWSTSVEADSIKYHDEQGAVAYALAPYIVSKSVELLKPSQYRVVCPLNKPPVESLDGLVAMHATYPEHPAFWKFIHEVADLTGLPSRPADIT
jgi:hypothetical protein